MRHFRVKCSCGNWLAYNIEHLGHSGKCPRCRAIMRLKIPLPQENTDRRPPLWSLINTIITTKILYVMQDANASGEKISLHRTIVVVIIFILIGLALYCLKSNSTQPMSEIFENYEILYP